MWCPTWCLAMKKNAVPIATAPRDGTMLTAFFSQGGAHRQWWLQPVYFTEGGWWWRGVRLGIEPVKWRSKQGGFGNNMWPRAPVDHRRMAKPEGKISTVELGSYYPGLILLAEDVSAPVA